MKTLLTLAALAACTVTVTAQSLLTDTPITPEKRAAVQLAEGIQSSKRAMLGELRHNISIVWDAPNPQAIIDELGTQAAEAFWLSNELATFLQNIMTAGNDTAGLAEVAAILAKVQPVTVHEDGTVTVDPTPTPTPTPEP
jgi:hypothetical protein